MKRFALLTSMVALSLGWLLIMAAPSQALDIAPKIEQCLAGTNQLSVVLMVDESKSLQSTDPANDRVTGIKSVLAALSQAVEDNSSERDLDVHVLFAGFYGDTHPKPDETVGGQGWLPLNGGTLGDLLKRADKYATANAAPQTDHAYALMNARELLNRRAVELSEDGSDPPCNLIVFFTDGAYFIGERGEGKNALDTTVPYAPSLDLTNPANAKKAVELGKAKLCDPADGIITKMGQDGIVLLTVALAAKTGVDKAERLEGERKAFLKSLSTGVDCGDVPGGIGDFVEAGTGSRLFFRFNDSLTGKNSKLTPLQPCRGEGCIEGGNPFEAIEGEKGFELLADIGNGGSGIRFVTPSGKKIEIDSNDSEEVKGEGVTLEPLWISDSVVQVNATFDRDSDAWVGGWNVGLVGSSHGALHSLTFSADLTPVLETPAVLERGDVTPVRFRLDDADGEELEANPVTRMIEAKGQLSSPGLSGYKDLEVRGPSDRLELETQAEIPVDNSSGVGEIGLTLNFDSPDGHQVEPIYQPFSFDVRLPESLGYPSVEPAELDLGAITGVGKTTGEVTFTGTAGNGCVWLKSADSDAPGGAGEIKVTTVPQAAAKSSCIPLKKGQSRKMTVTIAPAKEADGTVDVDLNFGLVSSIESGKDQTSTVHASFPIATEPNTAARAGIFALLLLAGAALPILLLHLLNRSGAKFSAPQSVQYLRQPIRLNLADGTVSGDGPDGAVSTDYDEFHPISSSGSEEKVRGIDSFQGTLRFRSVASGSRDPKLFTFVNGPVGMVRRIDGGKLVAGASGPLKDWDFNTWQEVPLELPGTWIFEIRDVRREDTLGEGAGRGDVAEIIGDLTLLIRFGGSIEQGSILFASAERALADKDWDSLAAPVPAEEKKPRTGGSWWSGRLRKKADRPEPSAPVPSRPTPGPDSSDPFQGQDDFGPDPGVSSGGASRSGDTPFEDDFSSGGSGSAGDRGEDPFGGGSSGSGGSSDSDDPFGDGNENW